MPTFDKKQRERMFLDAFLRAVPSLLPNDIEHDDKPDFVLYCSDRRIGVELREVVRNADIGMERHRDQEVLRWRLANRAKSMWDASPFPSIHVTCHFNRHHPLRDADLEGTVVALLDYVLANLPGPEATTTARGIDDWPRRLPKAIHTVSIGRFSQLTSSFWAPADSGWVVTLFPEELQLIIDRKNKQLVGYRDCADEYWLILCADDFVVSGAFSLADTCLEHRFHSGYDRLAYFARSASSPVWLQHS